MKDVQTIQGSHNCNKFLIENQFQLLQSDIIRLLHKITTYIYTEEVIEDGEFIDNIRRAISNRKETLIKLIQL